jgi:NADPH:quinone reductase-like Zn-dependent oxidoreductase
MQATVINRYGGPEVLELVEVRTPEPGRGEVRIAVAAAAVNPADLAVRAGWVDAVIQGRLPVGLGWDAAGTLDALGAGVDGFTVGQEVVALVDRFVAPYNAYATHVIVPAAAVALAPAGIDLIAAATLPLNAQTAAQALDLAALAPGQTLLVVGAAGAVGEYAVALAAQRGLKVIGLARPADEESVLAGGATEFVTSLDDVRNVDGVLDTAGIAAPALAAVRDGGTFIAFTDPTIPVAERGIRVAKVNVAHDGAQLAELVGAVEAGRLRLRVVGTFPLADAGAAHELVAAGGVRGRYVLIP